MKSPFRQHQQRVRAHMAGKAAQASHLKEPALDTEAGQEYVFMKVRLAEGLRILSDIESHEARKPVKARLAKDFADWIDGVLAADEPVQDEVLMTNMIWAIDTGDFERAVQIGAFALKHGLAMPERYNRSAGCFLREDIAQIALDAPEAVDHGLLLEIDQLTADADMPDAAKAKLNKALGRSWAAKAAAFDPSADSAPAGGAASYWQQALEQLRRALALDRKVGVKKDIETAERRLRELSGEDGESDSTTEQPPQTAKVAKPARTSRGASKRQSKRKK